MTFLGHAGFLGKTAKGTTVLIDPWLKNPKYPQQLVLPEKIDVILITHGHFDHAGDAKTLAQSKQAMVVGSYEWVESLQLPAVQSQGINPGGSIDVKDLHIVATEAVHSSGMGGVAMGYVVAVDKGPTFYHAGDTDAFASMALIAQRYHPQIALLPIGGHFTMDPQGAALAASLLGVKVVVPMHYGTFGLLTGTPQMLRKHLVKKINMLVAEPGITFNLGK